MPHGIVYVIYYRNKPKYVGSYFNKKEKDKYKLLKMRLAIHKSKSKKYPSRPIYKFLNKKWNAIDVRVVEYRNFKTKLQIKKLEQAYINQIGLENLLNQTNIVI